MSFGIVPRGSLVPASTEGAGTLLSRLSLRGKSAIVTGGGAGIGLAVAHGLAEMGADVALWYWKNEQTPLRAQEISVRYGVRCIAVKVDVRVAEEIENATNDSVKSLNNRLDVFVANAGIPWTSGEILSAEKPLTDYQDVMRTNVDGVFFSAIAASKHWKRQKEEGTNAIGQPLENFRLGSFIATASMSGSIVNIPQKQSVYNASKAAVIHLVRSLAVEWAGFARANTVSPGYMLTEISNFVPAETHELWQTRTPQGREGEPHELQGAYLYLASDAATYTTGTDIVVDGGYCLP